MQLDKVELTLPKENSLGHLADHFDILACDEADWPVVEMN